MVQLFTRLSDAELFRESFTSRMNLVIPINDVELLTTAITSVSTRDLFNYNFEITPFYCPECDACFCGKHWDTWDIFDDDGWHDSIRGSCPNRHERMLED